jgi:hypothetical protein
MNPMPLRRARFAALSTALLLLAARPVADSGKVLTLDDYGRWNRIVSTTISPDGEWVSSAFRPNGGDDTLYLKHVPKGTLHKAAGGAEPAFSDDSAWAAYVVNLPRKEADKLRKARKPVPRAVELIDLASGKTWRVENASSFTFPAGGKVMAVKRDKSDPEAKHTGVDLVLRTLATGEIQSFGNVGEYAFNKPGTRMAFTVDSITT